jgi:selenide, water dikinase
LLHRLPRLTSPDLLVDMETMDDAGVLRLSDNLALVQTLDFFQPVVNDPATFGRIVAANSLSDIWAMGGKAVTAMNILAYPSKKMSVSVIEELLTGACEKLREASVLLVGGHSMELQELFYGLSVTGTIHPSRVLTNAGARAGDKLVLTKPLGTSVYIEALSKDGLTDAEYHELRTSMERLNVYASEVLQSYNVSAMTDVTGFGLLGHALPFARNAEVTLRISVSAVPRFRSFFDLMKRYLPTQTWKNSEYVQPHVVRDQGIDDDEYALVTEPQTSGGLLVAVKEDQADGAVRVLQAAGDTSASVIGEVKPLRRGGQGQPEFIHLVG